MGALLLQWNYEKWALGSDLAAKVQGIIHRCSYHRDFPWPPGMPLLGKTWEPPCHPYYFTFGLVVTANVHPQLSGTRSLRPDIDDPARFSGGKLSGGRVPSEYQDRVRRHSVSTTLGFDDTFRRHNARAITESGKHGT
jgi:hypothetical protein